MDSKQHALDRIQEAEQAAWAYLVDFVKADLGPELAPYLDATFGGCEPHTSLLLRLPYCTEIVVQYGRASPGPGLRRLEDYTNLNWISLPWGSPRGPGKFAAVRYQLRSTPPDEAKVEPTGRRAVSNNIETVRIGAAEFAKEKQRLEQEVRRLIQEAYDRAKQVVDGRGQG
jgi:hypothetical protein